MDTYFKKLSIVKFIVLIILSYAVSIAVTGAAMAVNIDPLAPYMANGTWLIFLSSLGLYGGMMVLLWGISLDRHDRSGIFSKAPARSRSNSLFLLAPFSLGILFNLIYINLLSKFFPNFLEAMLGAGNLSANLKLAEDPISLALVLIAIVVLAPVVEEIAFRGIFYNLLNKYMPAFAAAVVSSIAFGLLHGLTFLQTAFMGMVLVVIYQVTGDLRTAIIAHGLNNALALMEAILISSGRIPEGSGLEMYYTGLMVGVSILVLAAAGVYLFKNHLNRIFQDVTPIYKRGAMSRQGSGLADGDARESGPGQILP
jgi:membrane protease YdiL (CAAX protease family)